MDNQSLSQKQYESHRNYMNNQKKNLLRKRRQQMTQNKKLNENS